MRKNANKNVTPLLNFPKGDYLRNFSKLEQILPKNPFC